MAGSLVLLEENILSSTAATVDLGASNWDSSYDVYQVLVTNQRFDAGNNVFNYRFLASGSPNETANYDSAYRLLRADATYGRVGSVDQTHLRGSVAGTGTGERGNYILYLYNFNNSSEYSSVVQKGADFDPNTNSVISRTGGGVLTVDEAHNGLRFFGSNDANFQVGTSFKLYGLKK